MFVKQLLKYLVDGAKPDHRLLTVFRQNEPLDLIVGPQQCGFVKRDAAEAKPIFFEELEERENVGIGVTGYSGYEEYDSPSSKSSSFSPFAFLGFLVCLSRLLVRDLSS